MMKIGDVVKTNKQYKDRLYEPLYCEEFTGVVKDIDKNDIVKVEIIKSSCNFKAIRNYHMDEWKKGETCSIHKAWLELAD